MNNIIVKNQCQKKKLKLETIWAEGIWGALKASWNLSAEATLGKENR
jgi:hypothetical protein